MQTSKTETPDALVGILMLDTRFPRLQGDVGHAGTWPFPVRYRVVRGASPAVAVKEHARDLIDDFVEAGLELVEGGVRLISTSCGFLTLFQKQLATRLGVAVATSALQQAGQIQACLPPGRRVGILTISRPDLTPEHLEAAGVPRGTPVWGLEEGCELQRVILGDEPALDVRAAEQDMRNAVTAFQARHPELGAILLECTNMPPYRDAVREETGLPVYSIETYLRWMAAAYL